MQAHIVTKYTQLLPLQAGSHLQDEVNMVFSPWRQLYIANLCPTLFCPQFKCICIFKESWQVIELRDGLFDITSAGVTH